VFRVDQAGQPCHKERDVVDVRPNEAWVQELCVVGMNRGVQCGQLALPSAKGIGAVCDPP